VAMTSSTRFKGIVGAVGALLALGLIVRGATRREEPAPEPPAAGDPAVRVQQRLQQLDRVPIDASREVPGGQLAVQRAAPPQTPVARPPAAEVPPQADEPPPPPPPPVSGNVIGPSTLSESEANDISTLSRIALTDGDVERRLEAVTLLGLSDEADVIPILGQTLNDADAEVRLAAIQGLEDFTGDAPVELLGNVVVNDPDADNRYEALEALSDIGGDRFTALAQRALSDPDEDVRTLAEGLLSEDEAPGTAPLRGAPR